jgi:triacylglycerol esterase/lipase EstA (alpha/beta hydrolase family)
MDTVVLCHGYPGFPKLGPINYFQGVAQSLREQFNVEVITPQVGPLGTIADRSRELERPLSDHFKMNPSRMHVIAHSVGGLDARHLVSPRGRKRSDLVKTLTTIGTPHRGTCLAELALGEIKLTLRNLKDSIITIIKDFSQIGNVSIEHDELEGTIKFLLGGERMPRRNQVLNIFSLLQETLQDATNYARRLINADDTGLRELTRESMEVIDQELTDSPDVQYFSFTGVSGIKEEDDLPIILYRSYLIASLFEGGNNDGWISVKSATRGESTRIIDADHAQQIGHALPSIGGKKNLVFDHLNLYKEIVEEAIA